MENDLSQAANQTCGKVDDGFGVSFPSYAVWYCVDVIDLDLSEVQIVVQDSQVSSSFHF